MAGLAGVIVGRALYSGAVDLAAAVARACQYGRMLCKRLIPCLDVRTAAWSRASSFVELRDAGDPVEAALAYDAQGADELVFLDITASHEDGPPCSTWCAAPRRASSCR